MKNILEFENHPLFSSGRGSMHKDELDDRKSKEN